MGTRGTVIGILIVTSIGTFPEIQTCLLIGGSNYEACPPFSKAQKAKAETVGINLKEEAIQFHLCSRETWEGLEGRQEKETLGENSEAGQRPQRLVGGLGGWVT